MRRSFFLLFLSIFLVGGAFGKDLYLPIAGSTSTVGSFKSDVRLFNPSSTKDITVQIFLLPVGNRDNTGAAAQSRLVGKRQMVILNDVVTALGGSNLNGIRLSSADDFVATERVYAVQTPTGSCNVGGSLGQDVPALDTSAAKRNGVLLQLKSSAGNCTQSGVSSFRTNVGVLNPNSVATNVTFRIYDKNNALIVGTPITIAPMGVLAPTNILSGLFFNPGTFDLTDGWVSYSSDQPIFAYASVIDNCTSDPTFVNLAEDISGASGSTREMYFPTATSTGSRADVRLFNPSSLRDITVQLTALTSGTTQQQSFPVPKRQMVSVNDLAATFGGTQVPALRLTSTDDFVATERVYAAQTPSGSCNIAGTVGEEVPALSLSAAKKQGLLLQLKSTTGSCSQAGGTAFRTNIGVLNPNASPAAVTFRLYDKLNNLISSSTSPVSVPAVGVIAPTNMTSGTFFTAGTADLSDAWVSYSSDQPVFVFASVVDTCTSDPTFFPMLDDSGGSTTTPPSAKSFAVTTRSFAIDFSPAPANSLNIGDQVTLTITGRDTTHGFQLQAPDGSILVDVSGVTPGQTITRTFTVPSNGTYNYFCTIPSCGTGHSSMFGQFVVGGGDPDPGPRY